MTEDKNKIARDSVNLMLENDAFSRWLGVELLSLSPGYCKISMNIRKEMLNGFHTAHGGITFPLQTVHLPSLRIPMVRISVALDVNMKISKKLYMRGIN
jgi:Uncharacterized protein, possibly involved in aromatic compounds catabolism